MKKYFFTALAAGLLLTSCQSDEPFAPGEGGEKQVTFTLNVPGDLGTRANEGYKSDEGGFTNTKGSLSYTLVLTANGDSQTLTATGEDKQVVFTPTIVLGRNYTVTAYAHFGDALNSLTAIEVNKHYNDESKDAYTWTGNINFATAGTEQNLTLTRPYGKLRLVATDYNVTGSSLNTAIESVKVTYSDRQSATFNATTGIFAFGNDYVNATEADAFDGYYAQQTDGTTTLTTLFADYIPANDQDNMIDFTVEVKYAGSNETYSRSFNDIPVRRNALTTLRGNFFTAGAEITVQVDENFDGGVTEYPTVEGKIMLNGTAYDTISAALSNAQNGDVIGVSKGEFEIPNNMYSSDKGVITFEGMGEETIFKFVNRNSGDAGLNSYAEGASLIFKNMKIVSPAYTSYSGGFGRAKYVEFNNCTFVGQYRSQSPVKFVDCTIDPENSYIYTDYSNADFERCKFNCSYGKGIQVYNDGNTTETTINISDCSFNSTVLGKTYDGKEVSAIDINSNGEEFVVNINNTTITNWVGIGAFSGSKLWNIKGGDEYVTINIDGNKVHPVASVNGVSYPTLNAALSAAQDYDVVNILAPGRYPTSGYAATNKILTLKGAVDGVEIMLINQADNNPSISFDGSTITFENLIITTEGGNYKGFARMNGTYKNCIINNNYFTCHGTHNFTNCTFNAPNDEHCTWTYGATEVNYTDCKFNYSDRCVNVYVDNGTGGVNVDFKNCKFITENAHSVGAVEINSSAFPKGAIVNLTDCIAPDYGKMVFISKWDSTSGKTAQVKVDGVDIANDTILQ